jgi:hypothetical protein
MHWHPFETAKIPEIAFRALLTECGAERLELVKGFRAGVRRRL